MKYKILITEDSKVSLAVIKKSVEKLGMITETAKDGIEALYRYRHDRSIVLIFLDINIPRMNGFETASAIRYMELKKNLKRVPIIAISADHDIEKKISNCDDFDGCITKPAKTGQFQDILEIHLVG